MSLSENIKRIRLDKNMTQEQLASRLGISAQAVSKWETSETYPDGSLLLPLAQELDVSLDELFDNKRVSMDDVSARIIRLFSETSKEARMNLARDIGWQIEKGLFNCNMNIDEKYSPDELMGCKRFSYILSDYGFTLVANGMVPFFSVFPEPKEGFGNCLEDREALGKIFTALSSTDTMNAILYLMGQKEDYIFEPAFIAKECNIADDKLAQVIDDLTFLGLIWSREIMLNGAAQILCHSCSGHTLIALFAVAQEVLYNGGYCFQSHYRSKPLIDLEIISTSKACETVETVEQ